MKFLILIFILAPAKAYAKLNQPTTDMSINISTESFSGKKCSDFVSTLDTNDATDYDLIKVSTNRCFLKVWLEIPIIFGYHDILVK